MKKEETLNRKCIVTGKLMSKDELLRFTVGPNAEVIPDFKKRLGGKGIYVQNSFELLHKAVQENLFAKKLKQKVKPVADLENMVENLLEKSALQAISMAKKTGNLVCGYEKVVDAVKQNKAVLVIEAVDAGADGTEKIKRIAKNIPLFELFKIEELDKALDRINTVHLALIKGDTAQMVENKLIKLADFLSSRN